MVEWFWFVFLICGESWALEFTNAKRPPSKKIWKNIKFRGGGLLLWSQHYSYRSKSKCNNKSWFFAPGSNELNISTNRLVDGYWKKGSDQNLSSAPWHGGGTHHINGLNNDTTKNIAKHLLTSWNVNDNYQLPSFLAMLRPLIWLFSPGLVHSFQFLRGKLVFFRTATASLKWSEYEYVISSSNSVDQTCVNLPELVWLINW